MTSFDVVYVDRDAIPEPTTGTSKWEPLRQLIYQLQPGGQAMKLTFQSSHEADLARTATMNVQRRTLEKMGASRVFTRQRSATREDPKGICYLWIWLDPTQ